MPSYASKLGARIHPEGIVSPPPGKIRPVGKLALHLIIIRCLSDILMMIIGEFGEPVIGYDQPYFLIIGRALHGGE